jgi:hypothetical protein
MRGSRLDGHDQITAIASPARRAVRVPLLGKRGPCRRFDIRGSRRRRGHHRGWVLHVLRGPAWVRIMSDTIAALDDAPSDKRLRVMAETDPRALRALLVNHVRLSPGDVARVASAARLAKDRSICAGPLHALALHHKSTIVREAALQGMEWDDSPDVRETLAKVARHDSSPTIREIASEMLAGLDE